MNRQQTVLKKRISLWALCGVLLWATSSEAELTEPMVKFFTLKETVAQLLPESDKLSRRDIVLNEVQQNRLSRFKNWDTDTTEFVVYHSKNAKSKITGSLVLFPEHTRQGILVVAVALDNSGKVVRTILMEAQQPTVRWILPLLRAGYMETFAGKDQSLKLSLSGKFRDPAFSPISRTYALRVANAVKKSAQLFRVVFKR